MSKFGFLISTHRVERLRFSFVTLTLVLVWINTLILLWLFGGGQIFLFISRTKGFWFDGFYGLSVGVFATCAASITVFLSSQSLISLKSTTLYLSFFVLLVFPIFLSERLVVGNEHANSKFLMLSVYVFAPALWAVLFKERIFNERAFLRLCVILLVLGNIFVFRYYFAIGLTRFRVGTESNAIGLSYAFSHLWIFVLARMVQKRQPYFLALGSMAALFNVFVLSTRQSFVYLLIAVVIFWVQLMSPFVINKKSITWLSFSMSRLKKICFALALLFFLLATLMPIISTISRDSPVYLSFETAQRRWDVFLESGYADEGRSRLFRNAGEIWMDHPILGQFAYERPGAYAHHMLMDSLGQYGLIGTVMYVFLAFAALIKSFKASKDNLFRLSFFPMLLGFLFVGMTVTTLVTNAVFHFLLFFWVTREPSETKHLGR